MTITPTAPNPVGDALLDEYDPAGIDEMFAGKGAVRDHWARISRSLLDLGLDELRGRRREADRLLDEDGVTYNVVPRHPGDRSASRHSRRWMLDPVPAVLSSEEWSRIERGVIQRTELLNLILGDLYGARDLLRTKLLPAELVFADPGFVREWDQIRLPGPVQLVTSGYDIARTGDGTHVVLADRAQAPSGFGYALENRVVASRVFPSLYRDSDVHRLAPFFRTLRAALLAAAPPGTDDPRVVVLTPGPHSETSFEHAFLA